MKRTGTLEQSNALKLACPFTSALSEAGGRDYAAVAELEIIPVKK